jgi:hypothetical protein
MFRLASRLACAGTLLAVVMSASAMAQPADKRTYFTFSGPVDLPGKSLPAGKYLFRLGDPTSGRRIVQVMSEDGRKPIGLFFSIPAQRPDIAEKPEVRFIETPRGAPAAIRTWWYPGERTGYEFIYPKEQARRLAKGAAQPVLTTQAQTTTAEQTNTEELTRVAASGEETKFDPESTPAEMTGRSQPGEVASNDVAMDESARASARRTSERSSLPRTASELPTVFFAGSLALMAGLGLWVTRRRQLL